LTRQHPSGCIRPREETLTNMDKLSDDLLQAIFQELDAVTLLTLSRVSKDFQFAADSDSTWKYVHGFTRTQSMTVITESKRRIRELGDLLWVARRAELKAGEIFFRAPSSDWVVSEQKRLDLTNAHQLWKDTTGNLDKATRDFSVALQMLRVPLSMRRDAARARIEYYAELKKAQRVKLDVSATDAARSRLTKINQDVALLVDEKALGTQTTFWWVATCCARSIWANPDEPLIMTD
jgi:hypothetical protein